MTVFWSPGSRAPGNRLTPPGTHCDAGSSFMGLHKPAEMAFLGKKLRWAPAQGVSSALAKPSVLWVMPPPPLRSEKYSSTATRVTLTRLLTPRDRLRRYRVEKKRDKNLQISPGFCTFAKWVWSAAASETMNVTVFALHPHFYYSAHFFVKPVGRDLYKPGPGAMTICSEAVILASLFKILKSFSLLWWYSSYLANWGQCTLISM